ncbi:MAG: hypothetical protein DMG06_28905 [Acidobacteria bacterium]|nr:MAG: hypothetical protein DMG06_28905 [Acidobacteriota bacterium]
MEIFIYNSKVVQIERRKSPFRKRSAKEKY